MSAGGLLGAGVLGSALGGRRRAACRPGQLEGVRVSFVRILTFTKAPDAWLPAERHRGAHLSSAPQFWLLLASFPNVPLC